MATRVFHPCEFNFADQDIRVDGSTISGGTSLSGYEDVIRTDGGGIWRADFSNADFGDRDDDGRAETLAWRSVNGSMQGGAVSVTVMFCDRHHQPVGPAFTVPGTTYATRGASCTVAAVRNGQVGGLRATVLDIVLISERPLLSGERFSYTGAGGWGERAAEIYEVEPLGGSAFRVTFSPPIRGGIAAGATLDFDEVRCRMRRTSPPGNPLNMGVFSTAAISFQEDMRRPVTP